MARRIAEHLRLDTFDKYTLVATAALAGFIGITLQAVLVFVFASSDCPPCECDAAPTPAATPSVQVNVTTGRAP